MGTPSFFKKNSFSLIKPSNPGFSRPMELSIPAGVSQVRGGGFPRRGLRVIVFVTIAPNFLKSAKSLNSSAYPKVHEAAITGFFNQSFPIFIFSLGCILSLTKEFPEH